MVAKHESLEWRYGEIEETWSEKDKVTILQVVRELQEYSLHRDHGGLINYQ